MVNMEPDRKRYIVDAVLEYGRSHANVAAELKVSRSTIGRVIAEYRAGADWVEAGDSKDDEDGSRVYKSISKPLADALAAYHEATDCGLERDVDSDDPWDRSHVSDAVAEESAFVCEDMCGIVTHEGQQKLVYGNCPTINDDAPFVVPLRLLQPIDDSLEVIKVNGVKAINALEAYNNIETNAVIAAREGVSRSSVSRARNGVHGALVSWYREYPLGDITEEAVKTNVRTTSSTTSVKNLGDHLKKEAPFKFMIDDKIVVIVVDGVPRMINKDNVNFGGIHQALVDKDWDKAYSLLNLRESIEKFTCGKVLWDGSKLTLYGHEVDSRLGARIINMLMNGDSENVIRSLSRFLEKLDQNPSNKVVSRIYDFLKFNDVTIDDDGDIIAFKVVNSKYKDLYSGNFDNSPGSVCEVKRHKVDENIDATCSYGLHVCAIGYITSYSGSPGKDRVVRVKMNPVDVVAIPRDYGDAKVRTCRYQVIDDVTDDYLRGNIDHSAYGYSGDDLYQDDSIED